MQENRLVAGSLGGALRLPFHPGRAGSQPSVPTEPGRVLRGLMSPQVPSPVLFLP